MYRFKSFSEFSASRLIAENRTIINRIYHLDRGYEYLEINLKTVKQMLKFKMEPKNLKLIARTVEDLK